jgi:putative DNA primase/helicase
VKEEDRIPDLAAKLLEEEAPGILRWAVLGCGEWLKSRLNEPETVREASQQYRKDEDGAQHFLDDCCVVTKDPDDKIERKELYTAYSKWSKDNHVWHLNRIPFAKDCKRLGVLEGADVRKWYGLKIRQFGDPEP